MASREIGIVLYNFTPFKLQLHSTDLSHGEFSSEHAPTDIPAGSWSKSGGWSPGTSFIKAESAGFMTGTEGEVQWDVRGTTWADDDREDGTRLRITFDKPYLGSAFERIDLTHDVFGAPQPVWGRLTPHFCCAIVAASSDGVTTLESDAGGAFLAYAPKGPLDLFFSLMEFITAASNSPHALYGMALFTRTPAQGTPPSCPDGDLINQIPSPQLNNSDPGPLTLEPVVDGDLMSWQGLWTDDGSENGRVSVHLPFGVRERAADKGAEKYMALPSTAMEFAVNLRDRATNTRADGPAIVAPGTVVRWRNAAPSGSAGDVMVPAMQVSAVAQVQPAEMMAMSGAGTGVASDGVFQMPSTAPSAMGSQASLLESADCISLGEEVSLYLYAEVDAQRRPVRFRVRYCLWDDRLGMRQDVMLSPAGFSPR